MKHFSLEAMAQDEAEAEAFADRLEELGLYMAPFNLKSSILNGSRQADVRLIAGTNHFSKKPAAVLQPEGGAGSRLLHRVYHRHAPA